MTETESVFIVFEETDNLYVNFFIAPDAAESWAKSDRMGDTILGPFDVEGDAGATPFEVVVGADQQELIEHLYHREAVVNAEGTHANLLGPYPVYKSMEEFEQQCR